MLTDLKLIKEARNYTIKFFNQRPKDVENYGCLLMALDEVIKSVEEEYLKIAQKIIDLGIDDPIYIKEQKKWLIPEIIESEIIKLMIVEKDDYKKLSQNPITTNDDILQSKVVIEKNINNDNIDVDINKKVDVIINSTTTKDCEACRKPMSECGACLTANNKTEG